MCAEQLALLAVLQSCGNCAICTPAGGSLHRETLETYETYTYPDPQQNYNTATYNAFFCMQSQKEGINVSGIEEDLQAATDKYNKAREHVRSSCYIYC